VSEAAAVAGEAPPGREGLPEAPLVSVVLVSYHSQGDLARSLPALRAQEGVRLQLIVVDNAPGDGTAAWLRQAWPEVEVVAAARNGGYAGGNNLGARRARGEYVLFLNPDAEPAPGALQEMVHVAEAYPGALVTPKLLLPDGRVNACGTEMHYSGVTTCGGLGQPASAFVGVFPVLLVSGAAFLVRRVDWEALGGFAEEYFMYVEDTEFSLRARLLGHPVLCAADAVVWHRYRLAMRPEKLFLLERNRLLTLLRIYEGRTLWRLWPGIALAGLATWAYAALRGRAYLRQRARAAVWVWRHRAVWGAARARIQRSRRVPDAVLLAAMRVALPFEQLVANPQLARWLHRATTPLFRAARPGRGAA
jgi:GT2 family glycosyltransferase